MTQDPFLDEPALQSEPCVLAWLPLFACAFVIGLASAGLVLAIDYSRRKRPCSGPSS